MKRAALNCVYRVTRSAGRDLAYAAYREREGRSLDDFADHATEVTPPLSTTYRGYTIYENALPTQGFVVLESLNICEQAPMAQLGLSSAAGVHTQASDLRLAFAAPRLADMGRVPRRVPHVRAASADGPWSTGTTTMTILRTGSSASW